MADPHFMYRQQHGGIDPKVERKKTSARSWAKRLSGVLLVVGAIGLTAYSFAGTESPIGAVAIDATQTQKGAAIVATTNIGNVWVGQVTCADKLSAEKCKANTWLNLGGDFRDPSITVRSGSTDTFHIVAIGKDDKAYSVDVTCAENCAVTGAKASPSPWQMVPGRYGALAQVMTFSPLSPPVGATCEGTLLLEKTGTGKVLEAATCSDGSNSGELQPIVLRKNDDTIVEDAIATKSVSAMYASNSFGRSIYLQTKTGEVSLMSDIGYNDQPFVYENTVMATKSLKQSSHAVTMQGTPGLTKIKAFGVRPDGTLAQYFQKGSNTSVEQIYSSLKDQKDIYTGLDGYIVRDDVNRFRYVFPISPSNASTGSNAVDLGGGFPIAVVVDAKIFVIDDTGTLKMRTYAPKKDAVGTVTGVDQAKSQDWTKL